MKGWEVSGAETLGMHQVVDKESSLYGTTPAPRVLQNQLDRKLEEYCAETEVVCLNGLQRAMLRKTAKQWTVIFTATLLLLHVWERDIWRLLYWTMRVNSVRHLHP